MGRGVRSSAGGRFTRSEPAGLVRELGLGPDRLAWIEAVRAGLATDVFVRLARRLGVSEAELADAGQRSAGGPTPLAFADTEFGAREVEGLLNRIEYGVYRCPVIGRKR